MTETTIPPAIQDAGAASQPGGGSGAAPGPAQVQAAAPGLVLRRPAGWALGGPALALIWVGATLSILPRIEHEIRRETLRPGPLREALAGHRAVAEVDGRDVTIVADLGLPDSVRERSEGEITRIPGVRSVRTEIAVPVAMAPFELRAARSPTGFSLSGGVPDPDLRAGLVGQAGSRAPADAIDDRLRLGTGAPPGFGEAATALMSALALASRGEFVLTGTTYRIRAEAPDGAAYAAIRAALGTVPPGFAPVETDILPPLMEPFGWTARLDSSGLVLEGGVPSEAMRATLMAVAASALPGGSVRDEMRTARGLDPRVDLAALAAAALPALVSLQAGRAELVGRRFVFTGESAAKGTVGDIERQLRARLAPGLSSEVTVRSVPASPYGFTARRAAGRITLTGFVPSEGERRTAAAIVKARFPGDALADDRLVADGSPAGFEDAQRFALETLAEFAEGEAVLRDRELRFSGAVLYRQLAERLRERVPRSAPDGWTASIALRPTAADGALDSYACAGLLADAQRRQPIRFEPGRAEPSPSSKAAVDAVAGIVRRCGVATIQIVHRMPAGSDPEAARSLATQRAVALAAVLRSGPDVRLSGEGTVAPVGQAAERTEFQVSAPEGKP